MSISTPPGRLPPDQMPDLPMLGAVMNDEVEDVKKLASKKIGLEERIKEKGPTPLIRAASQGSWQMVEILLKSGADPWAYDKFGSTIGQDAFMKNFYPLEKEVPYLKRVRKILLKIGYTDPFIPPKDVLRLVKEGKWPPAGVKLTAEGIEE